MANQKEAYDFSLFEPSRKEQEQQRPAPSKQPKKKNNLIRISEEQLEKSRRIKYKPTTVIGGILFYLYRAKKRGEVCIGCPYGRQCTGHCGGHGQETKHKKKH